MQVSRSLLNSIKNRSIQTLNTYGRFIPPKRFHSASCMRSARKTNDPLLLTGPSPTSKSWKPYLLPGAILGGFGGLILFLHYNDERRAIPKGQGEKFERSAIQGPIIGGPFSLIDTEGRLVTERNLLGNWALLYFGYTSSPDVGPAEVQKMAKAMDILGSKQDHHKILPVFVTIDPQRDTPSHLRAYLKGLDLASLIFSLSRFWNGCLTERIVERDPTGGMELKKEGVQSYSCLLLCDVYFLYFSFSNSICIENAEFDPRIIGLTGPVAAVRQMTQEYRVYFKKVDEEGDDYLVESSHNMYLVNPKMEVVRCFGVEYSGEELADAILKELKKAET